MQIKQAALAVGLSPEAIRYYEREGLVEQPQRTGNGYRSYGPVQLERLRFIANCRALEMSHQEIRQLIELCAQPKASCAAVNHVVQEHVQHVEARIETLQALLVQLRCLQRRCKRVGRMDTCDIVASLATEAQLPAVKQRHAQSHI
jgi:DNA-binding transcriptional MerR regulator